MTDSGGDSDSGGRACGNSLYFPLNVAMNLDPL